MAKCISPIKLKDSGAVVPCGRCYPCKMRRVSAWSFRMMKEAERSRSAFFITLTYDNDHVPISPNGFMTLDLPSKQDGRYKCSHMQLFIKRLRRGNDANSKWPLKYYYCGEYGSETLRPHYHMILFNATIENLLGIKYASAYEYGTLNLDGKTEFKCDAWPCGHVTIGDLSMASVGYTLKYISKDSQVGKYSRDDRVKEFSMMSKCLGDNYLTPEMKAYHLADVMERMYCTTVEGDKITMPRYYKLKIYTDWQRKSIAYRMEQEAIAEYNRLRPEQREIDDTIDENARKHYASKQGKDERSTTL